MPAAELQNVPLAEVPDPKLQSEGPKTVGPEVVVESTPPARPDYVRVRYTILDMPPLPEAILLGFQQCKCCLSHAAIRYCCSIVSVGSSRSSCIAGRFDHAWKHSAHSIPDR